MKLINIRDIKLDDGWVVETLELSKPYAGLIEGDPHSEPVKKMFNKVVHMIVKKTGYDEARNVVPRHQDNGLLKPLKVKVRVIDASYDRNADITTHFDEGEDIEDVLNEIIRNPLFMSVEFWD